MTEDEKFKDVKILKKDFNEEDDKDFDEYDEEEDLDLDFDEE